MLLFNHGFRVTKHIRVSGLFCVNDQGPGRKMRPSGGHLARPREQRLSSLFQVAGSIGQSSPPCPPGKEPLLFACAFTPLFFEGERVQLASTQPTLGLLRPCCTLGKGAPSQQDFPLRLCGGACSLRPQGFGCDSSRSARWVVPARVELLLDAKQLRGFP